MLETITGTVTGRTRRETCRSNRKLYSKMWSQKGKGQTMANRYNTGKTKSNPRASEVYDR